MMTNKLLFRPLAYVVSLLCITCCSACGDDDECFTPPAEFVLDVRDENGNSLLGQYEEEDIWLYYWNENGRRIPVDFYKEGIIFSRELPFKSIEGNSTFYLETGDVIDTLEVEVMRDQRLEDCTVYIYRYVVVNGEEALLDSSSPNIPPVYVVVR